MEQQKYAAEETKEEATKRGINKSAEVWLNSKHAWDTQGGKNFLSNVFRRLGITFPPVSVKAGNLFFFTFVLG